MRPQDLNYSAASFNFNGQSLFVIGTSYFQMNNDT